MQMTRNINLKYNIMKKLERISIECMVAGTRYGVDATGTTGVFVGVDEHGDPAFKDLLNEPYKGYYSREDEEEGTVCFSVGGWFKDNDFFIL